MPLQRYKRSQESAIQPTLGDVRGLDLPLEKKADLNFPNDEAYHYYLACVENDAAAKRRIEPGIMTWWGYHYGENVIDAALIWPGCEADFTQLPEALEFVFTNLEKAVASEEYKQCNNFSEFLSGIKIVRYLAPEDPRTEQYWQILLEMQKQRKVRTILNRLYKRCPEEDYMACCLELGYLFGEETLNFIGYSSVVFIEQAEAMVKAVSNDYDRYAIFAFIRMTLPTALPQIMQMENTAQAVADFYHQFVKSEDYLNLQKENNIMLTLRFYKLLLNLVIIKAHHVKMNDKRLQLELDQSIVELAPPIAPQPTALEI